MASTSPSIAKQHATPYLAPQLRLLRSRNPSSSPTSSSPVRSVGRLRGLRPQYIRPLSSAPTDFPLPHEHVTQVSRPPKPLWPWCPRQDHCQTGRGHPCPSWIEHHPAWTILLTNCPLDVNVCLCERCRMTGDPRIHQPRSAIPIAASARSGWQTLDSGDGLVKIFTRCSQSPSPPGEQGLGFVNCSGPFR